MNMKKFMIVIIAITFLSYLYGWYMDELVPAWQAAIWTFLVLVQEIAEYLDEKPLF
jgi:hypothetical protein